MSGKGRSLCLSKPHSPLTTTTTAWGPQHVAFPPALLTTWQPLLVASRTSPTRRTQGPTSGSMRQDGSFVSPSSSRPRVQLPSVMSRSPDHPSQRPPSTGTAPTCMPRRWAEVALTPPAAVLTNRKPRVPRPDRIKGTSYPLLLPSSSKRTRSTYTYSPPTLTTPCSTRYRR